MALPEAYLRSPLLSHLRIHSSYSATLGWLARPAELSLAGVRFLACLTLLDQLVPGLSLDDALRSQVDILLGIDETPRSCSGSEWCTCIQISCPDSKGRTVLGMLDFTIGPFKGMFFASNVDIPISHGITPIEEL